MRRWFVGTAPSAFAGTNETLNGFDEIVAAIGARVTRVVVEGETAAERLRVSVDPRTPAVFSWEREFLAAG